MTIVLSESGLAGSGGIGGQLVGQLGSFVELVNGRTEHLVLLPILLRRIEAVDLVGKPFERGLVSLHLLDVIGGKSIVRHKLLVAIPECLHGFALYVTNPNDVLCFGIGRASWWERA